MIKKPTVIESFAKKPEFTELLEMWAEEMPAMPPATRVNHPGWPDYWRKVDDLVQRVDKRSQEICQMYYPNEDPKEWSMRASIASGIVSVEAALVEPEDII